MIYFVQGERSGMVKIGHTTRMKRRLAELKVGSPERLIVLAVLNGGPHYERVLHERFASARSHGEWFHPTLPLMKFIGRKSIKDDKKHPAQIRKDINRRIGSDKASRERADAIQLAADKAGVTPREWMLAVAREQIASSDA